MNGAISFRFYFMSVYVYTFMYVYIHYNIIYTVRTRGVQFFRRVEPQNAYGDDNLQYMLIIMAPAVYVPSEGFGRTKFLSRCLYCSMMFIFYTFSAGFVAIIIFYVGDIKFA